MYSVDTSERPVVLIWEVTQACGLSCDHCRADAQPDRHTGERYPSGFLPRSGGSVRERPVDELYREAPLFHELRDRDALEGKCGACPYRTICGGSRSRAYAHTGNPLASDPLCPYVPPAYDGPLRGSASARALPREVKGMSVLGS